MTDLDVDLLQAKAAVHNYLQMTPTGQQRFLWWRVHSPRHFSKPEHWRLPIGLVLSRLSLPGGNPALFITFTTCKHIGHPSILTSLAPRWKPACLQTKLASTLVKLSSHKLPQDPSTFTSTICPLLWPPDCKEYWWDGMVWLPVSIFHRDVKYWHISSFFSLSLLTSLPLIFFSLRPSTMIRLLFGLPQVSLFWRHFRSPSLCEMFNLW